MRTFSALFVVQLALWLAASCGSGSGGASETSDASAPNGGGTAGLGAGGAGGTGGATVPDTGNVAGVDASADQVPSALDAKDAPVSASSDGLKDGNPGLSSPDLPADICIGQADGFDCSLGRLDNWSCLAGVCTPAAGRPAGGEPSLLEGAVPFTGPSPAPGTVSITVDGSPVELAAFPGQVVVLFATPVPAAVAARSTIEACGAVVLAQIPMVGAYLVGVQPGREDALIQGLQAGEGIAAATPNLVLEGEQAVDADTPEVAGGPGGPGAMDTSPMDASQGRAPAIVAIFEGDCNPSIPPQVGCSGPEVPGLHACHVATVLASNEAPPTHCYETDFGGKDRGFVRDDGGVAAPNKASSLWNAIWALAGASDSAAPARPVFINMSFGPPLPSGMRELFETCVYWNKPDARRNTTAVQGAVRAYEQGKIAFWQVVTLTVSAALAAHPGAANSVAVTISAGNFGVSLDRRMQKLAATMGARTSAGGTSPGDVLWSNILIVTQARPNTAVEPRFDFVSSWSPDSAHVVATTNSWAAYGTSFAAPYALAQVYRLVAEGLSATPADAVRYMKQEAGKNGNHVISSPLPMADQPAIPPKQTGEMTPTTDSLLNCPIGSSWEPSIPSCVFGYLKEKEGQVVCPSVYPLVSGPWLASLQWPSMKAQLGLGSPWIDVKSDTCDFDDTYVTATPTAGPLSQRSLGLVGPGCDLKSTTGDLCSWPLTLELTGDQCNYNICGTSVVTDASQSVATYGYFSAPLATKWPELPADCAIANVPGLLLCLANSAAGCTLYQ
jgi:hypothetical protein